MSLTGDILQIVGYLWIFYSRPIRNISTHWFHGLSRVRPWFRLPNLADGIGEVKVSGGIPFLAQGSFDTNKARQLSIGAKISAWFPSVRNWFRPAQSGLVSPRKRTGVSRLQEIVKVSPRQRVSPRLKRGWEVSTSARPTIYIGNLYAVEDDVSWTRILKVQFMTRWRTCATLLIEMWSLIKSHSTVDNPDSISGP